MAGSDPPDTERFQWLGDLYWDTSREELVLFPGSHEGLDRARSRLVSSWYCLRPRLWRRCASTRSRRASTRVTGTTSCRTRKARCHRSNTRRNTNARFEAAVVGAYYGRLMADAEREQRICGVPYDPAAQVYTAWDLGIADSTAIWWAQMVGREIHLIDYYEASGVDLGHYVREINATAIRVRSSYRAVRRTG